MISQIWTLSINGGAYATLASLNASQVQIEHKSLDVSTLSFVVSSAANTDACPFNYGDSLILKRNATVWFIGRVRRRAGSIVGGRLVWSIAARDIWWEFEHTVYRQPAAVTKDDFSGLQGFMSTRVTINQDAWGVAISQADQISNAMGYATGVAPGLFSLAAMPTLPTWPREETREITVAEAIRRASSSTPGATGYSDFGGGIQAVTFKSFADLSTVTLDLSDANLIEEVNGLDSRDELKPAGVVFDFWTTQTDGDGKQLAKLTRQTGGSPGAVGTLYGTFNLGPCDTIPSGAASAYYTALNSLQWEGSIALKEDQCTGSVRPGNRINITNGPTAWATMYAVVHTVTERLDSGSTVIETGPNPVLGADDFVGLLNRIRNRPAPTGYCNTQHNGTEGVSGGIDDDGNPTTVPAGGTGAEPGINGPATGNKPGVGSPAPNPDASKPSAMLYGTVDVAACVSGTPVTVRVVGYPV